MTTQSIESTVRRKHLMYSRHDPAPDGLSGRAWVLHSRDSASSLSVRWYCSKWISIREHASRQVDLRSQCGGTNIKISLQGPGLLKSARMMYSIMFNASGMLLL